MIIDCLNLDGKPTKDNGKPSPVAKKIRSLAEDEDSLNRAVRKLAEPKKDHFGHQAWEVVTSYANGKYKGWFPEPPKLVTGK